MIELLSGVNRQVLRSIDGAFFSILCQKGRFWCVKVIRFSWAYPYQRIIMNPPDGAMPEPAIPLFSFRKMVYY